MLYSTTIALFIMSENSTSNKCLNCNTPFVIGIKEKKEIFCINCGQSNLESRLSFIRLIRDAISNVFNLDSRLIHTFRDIFYPSKLTRTYIEGKRKYYVNPVRLFVFLMLALITISLYCITLDNSAMGVDEFYAKAERSKMMEEYESLVDTLSIAGHEEILDTIKDKLYFGVKELHKDTLGKNGPQFFTMGRSTESFGISRYDAIHMSHKKLFEKYGVTDFWDKLNVGQYIRLATNPVGGIKHLVKNLTWAVFITVLLISFFMKLLYIRKNYYLVEHVVLVLNSHSLLFLLVGLILLINFYFDFGNQDGTIELIIFLSCLLFVLLMQFLTLKRYYKQGFIKTFIKQILINSFYLIIFNITVFVVALISLILY